MLIKVLIVVLMFACIVIVHEWGHFITAKKCGVLVHEFAVGMGPKIWSTKRGETVYSIRILPIGGFCSMEEEVGGSTNPRAMGSKNPWQKLLIVSAGAIMNFLLGWLLVSIILGYSGYASNEIANITSNSSAEISGLMVGDRIVGVNGHEIKELKDISQYITDEAQTYTLTVKRDGKGIIDLKVPTTISPESGRAVFGFTAKLNHWNIPRNIIKGLETTCSLVKQICQSFVQLLTGQVGMDQVAGIVGVVDESVKQWDQGMATGGITHAAMNMLAIAAMLSVNLFIVNLLPLPALDGGRIVFIVIEILRGKPVSAEKEGAVHFIGLVLLMLLTVVILYNDVMRIAV